MDSIKSDSKLNQIKEELFEEKIGLNSLNTYISPENLWSFHYIQQNINSDHNLAKESSAKSQSLGQLSSLVNSPKRESTETKIQIESESNFIIQQPAGPFADQTIRNAFIRKVYSILSVQLSVTVAATAVMMFCFRDNLNFKHLEKTNNKSGMATALILLISGIVASFAVLCSLACFEYLRKTVPINFILLAVMTVGHTIWVGIVCCQHHGKHVFIAFVITAVIVIAITILATTPWFDITNCGLVLCIFAIIHMVMGLIIYLVMFAIKAREEDMKPWLLILAVAGAFLFSVYLLYDTQLILGGKKYELSPEEYVAGAVWLYVDIIQIFLYLLMILGLVDK